MSGDEKEFATVEELLATSEEDEASEVDTDSLLGSSGDEAPVVITEELLRQRLEIWRDFIEMRRRCVNRLRARFGRLMVRLNSAFSEFVAAQHSGVPPDEVARRAHAFVSLDGSTRAAGQELAEARAFLSSLVSERRDIARQLHELGGK